MCDDNPWRFRQNSPQVARGGLKWTVSQPWRGRDDKVKTSFRMLSRTRPAPSAGFIEPCLLSLAERPPSGPGWIHEIKHDGYRLMARRDAAGVRLLTRNGHDWASRFPLIVEAVTALKAGSCLIDGEAVVCDDNGVAVFAKLRQRRNDRQVVPYAFDLLELDGQDLRREPLERRKYCWRGCSPGQG
jgi:ATP-dependent DNA ligase